MPVAQCVQVLKRQCRVIKSVQTMYSEAVSPFKEFFPGVFSPKEKMTLEVLSSIFLSESPCHGSGVNPSERWNQACF